MDPPPSPPYAHVFQGQPKTPWYKLDDDRCLSMLHKKYWGKNIIEDMHQWQEIQTGYQPMDTDQSNVSPANFPISFDIEDLDPSGLWVREEYVLFYDYCVAYFNKPNIRSAPEPPSIIITGQPGIGE